MTEKAKRQDREDAREDRERLSAGMSQERTPETLAQDELTGTAPTEGQAVAANEAAPAAGETPRPRARRSPRKSASAESASAEPVKTAETPASAQEPLVLPVLEADALELESQGFSPDEAQRLIDISKRLETSAEARASQAELKRLRFAQWLIEHGILDEFSA